MKKITMIHPSGVKTDAHFGFSWTSLFFGPMVPMMRGDIRHINLYMLAVAVIVGLTTITFSLPAFFAVIIAVVGGAPPAIATLLVPKYLTFTLLLGITTLVVWWFTFAINYNDWYMRNMMMKGFVEVKSEEVKDTE